MENEVYNELIRNLQEGEAKQLKRFNAGYMTDLFKAVIKADLDSNGIIEGHEETMAVQRAYIDTPDATGVGQTEVSDWCEASTIEGFVSDSEEHLSVLAFDRLRDVELFRTMGETSPTEEQVLAIGKANATEYSHMLDAYAPYFSETEMDGATQALEDVVINIVRKAADEITGDKDLNALANNLPVVNVDEISAVSGKAMCSLVGESFGPSPGI